MTSGRSDRPPRVSVVMPVYNGAAHLREALDSLLAQTLTDFEIIAVDDGSTDASAAILEGCRDARLRVQRQANTGQTGALNKGLHCARGEYIARMDQDDVSEPERLARQVAFMEAHPEVGLLGTAYTLMTADRRPLRTTNFPVADADLRGALGRSNPFGHSTVMFRHSLIDRIGPYIQDRRFPQFQDYELWIRIASYAHLANLPEPLVRYRVHRQSSSAGNDDAVQRCNLEMRANAIRRLRLPWWMWYHVFVSRVALALPLPLRNRVRRWLGRPLPAV